MSRSFILHSGDKTLVSRHHRSKQVLQLALAKDNTVFSAAKFFRTPLDLFLVPVLN